MNNLSNYSENIKNSRLSIYDPIKIGDPDLWIPSPELEVILNDSLQGVSLNGLPIRTRSKVVKELVCDAIGYPRPKSFKKCNPRFIGQHFDTYVQKSNNLQIWNEELDTTRRYVLIGVDANDIIKKIKVVTGDILATLDTTGTLTQKYQARIDPGSQVEELISDNDTPELTQLITSGQSNLSTHNPTSYPASQCLLPIGEIFKRIRTIVGTTFKDAGADQERNRGADLHKIVCDKLGYKTYADDGQFPDVKHQLLEVKLQTSPTIDLGLVTPESKDPLDIPMINNIQVRHCDVRYALFYGVIKNGLVCITNVYLTTGNDFFSRFPQFGGKVLNKKLQIPLPRSFFS